MIGRLPLLLSVELLVLIAAIFLLVYITKQQVSKWFTYGTSLIIVFILFLMVCSVCCAICMRHCGPPRGMNGDCKMEQECGPGGMMHHGCMKRIIIRDGKCAEDMEEGEMNEEGGGDKPCCKKGMHEDQCMKKEMIVTEKDSIPKKEVIIKKK